MRQDKLTTKFQQALADAQSLTVSHDNQMIEPQHLLLALLQQDDEEESHVVGIARSGTDVRPEGCSSRPRDPGQRAQVEGHEQCQASGNDLRPTCSTLPTRRQQKPAGSRIHRQRDVPPARRVRDKGEAGRLASSTA